MSVKCPGCGHRFDLTKNLSGFDAFWAVYPRKIAKGQARKAYTAALTKVPEETITSGAKAFGSLCQKRKTETIHIPHPSTWLNGERFSDEELRPFLTSVGSEVFKAITIHPSWGELAEKLSKAIGPDKFSHWLGSAELKPGNPSTIVVTTAFRKDWIVQHWRYDLERVLGPIVVVVA